MKRSICNVRQGLANNRAALKNILCFVSPELYSKYLFFRILGRRLDLKHPSGMDEKLMWLKLHTYRNNQLVTQCSDKYSVRKYVVDCGCEDILNDLYAVFLRNDPALTKHSCMSYASLYIMSVHSSVKGDR